MLEFRGRCMCSVVGVRESGGMGGCGWSIDCVDGRVGECGWIDFKDNTADSGVTNGN